MLGADATATRLDLSRDGGQPPAESPRLRGPLLGLLGLLVLAYPLTGCESYWMAGVMVFSRTTALDRQAARHADLLAPLQPVLTPIGGSALVLLPSDLEVRRNYITYGPGGLPSDKGLTFLTTATRRSFQFMADAIQDGHLFDSTTVAFHDGNPATYPIGKHDFLVFRDVDGWFIKGKGGAPPRVVAVDPRRYGRGYVVGVKGGKGDDSWVHLSGASSEPLSAFLDELKRQAGHLGGQ